MKLLKHLYCCSLAAFLSGGCLAPDYGQRYPEHVQVDFFTSEAVQLTYYILTLAQNEKLYEGYGNLSRASFSEKLRNMVDPGYTGNGFRKIDSGEYVIVVACGDYYSRKLFDFDEKRVRKELSCSGDI